MQSLDNLYGVSWFLFETNSLVVAFDAAKVAYNTTLLTFVCPMFYTTTPVALATVCNICIAGFAFECFV